MEEYIHYSDPSMYDALFEKYATFKLPPKGVKHPVSFDDYPNYVCCIGSFTDKAFIEDDIRAIILCMNEVSERYLLVPIVRILAESYTTKYTGGSYT